jgi:hypothetical protein
MIQFVQAFKYPGREVDFMKNPELILILIALLRITNSLVQICVKAPSDFISGKIIQVQHKTMWQTARI